MAQKLKVAILCGGRSAEHEVSLQSAKNVYEALDKSKYEAVIVGINKDGRWYNLNSSQFLIDSDDPKKIRLNLSSQEVAFPSGLERRSMISMVDGSEGPGVDVVFPVLHGTFGEDGTVQGLLKMADIPFVGASVLGSAVGMDKDVMKRLLRDAGLPMSKFQTFRRMNRNQIRFQEVKSALGLPFFVKPANAGSSVGISKVKSESDFKAAIDLAFEYDRKIVIEEAVSPVREIECSVLGNEGPIASLPGEIVVKAEFYSYEAKYIDSDASYPVIPAKIPEAIQKQVQELAVKAYLALCCEGLARVDFFLKDSQLFINEINTLPGFTRISMYPKMWDASGIAYPDLIDRLIQLALERYEQEKKIKTTF